MLLLVVVESDLQLNDSYSLIIVVRLVLGVLVDFHWYGDGDDDVRSIYLIDDDGDDWTD